MFNGGGVAVGDVNNDNLEDIFIGGSKGQAGQLFIQINKERVWRNRLSEGC